MNLKNTRFHTPSQSGPGIVSTAAPKLSGSEQPTPPTSEYLAGFSSNQKDTLPAETGPSLLLSDPSIPPSTYVSSSLPITGVQSSTSNVTQSGLSNTGSYTQSGNEYPMRGCPGLGKMHYNGDGSCPNCNVLMQRSAMAGLPYAGMTEHRSSALDVQIGGTHYKDFPIQPIEFIHKNGIGFIAGNVIKYVCRYRAKGGATDLLKARHYIDMLIEQERQDP